MEAGKKERYFKKVKEEPYAKLLNIRLKDVGEGPPHTTLPSAMIQT